MKRLKIIQYGLILSLSVSIFAGLVVFFEFSFHHFLIETLFYFCFATTILALMQILLDYCPECPQNLQTRLVYLGFSILFLGFFVWYNIFTASIFWHILIGTSVLFLLAVELQLLGWTKTKQPLLVKLIFLLSILSNLFLAFILFFKVALLSLYPIIIGACVISILVLFYGLYIRKPNHIELNKPTV